MLSHNNHDYIVVEHIYARNNKGNLNHKVSTFLIIDSGKSFIQFYKIVLLA